MKFGCLTLALLLLTNCGRPDPATIRFNREMESSWLESELRQLHSRQRFGPLTVSGTRIDELYDPWFFAVYEIAPEVDGGVRMTPRGIIRGGIADRPQPASLDLTGKSPLESLNLICAAFDVHFEYTDDHAVVIGASKEEPGSGRSFDGEPAAADPFASDDEAAPAAP